MSFKNKVVIVTGGSAGIGATTALKFVKESAKVVIVGRNDTKLKEVAKKCHKFNGDYHIIRADITNEREANNIREETLRKYGKIDVLVNNAGILREGTILDGGMMKIYDDIMNTNLKAVVLLTCLIAPHLIITKGSIVNISSVAGTKVISPNYTAYATSKAGLDVFTRGTALEMGPHGVRVNSISPGPVKTEISRTGGIDGDIEDFKSFTALGRISQPEEVADLVLYLASDKAKGITGSNFVCDNGYLIH